MKYRMWNKLPSCSWLLAGALLSIVLAGTVSAESLTYEHYHPTVLVPIGGSYTDTFTVSSAPVGALVTSVDVQFRYIAYDGVQAYVSSRINKGSDPGPTGGAVVVAQGSLPSSPSPGGTLGTFQSAPIVTWNGQAANGTYFVRFATATGSLYKPTIDNVRLTVNYTVPVVNPQVSVSPPSGPQGTTFSEPGTGFTPNGTATLHFLYPTSVLQTLSKAIDPAGAYQNSWTCNGCPAGTYQYWAVDDATGRSSNTASFTVTAVVNPQVSVSPPSGPQGTTFSEPGTGFTPNRTATLHFLYPTSVLQTLSKAIDPVGAYQNPWTCNGCPAGTYQYWAVDDATGRSSNTVAFAVTAVVNPNVSVAPSSGPRGTTFSEPGTGFTPNNTAVLHFVGPDGLELTPVPKPTDGIGAYSHSWPCNGCSPGTYQYWGVDSATGAASNRVSFAVSVPQVSVTPSNGPQGTTFSEPGSGFSLNNTAALHFVGPDGLELTPVTKSTDGNGAYSHSWQCNGCPPGAYQYWAVDNATGTSSGTVNFTVTTASTGFPALVPLHRLYKYDSGANTRDHFYTTSEVEKNQAVATMGYVYEGIEGYISSSAFSGSVPLYRLYKGSTNSHFYTKDASERSTMLGSGYADEGIAGYLFPALAEGLVPLYRMKQTTGTPDHYLLSTSRYELDRVLALGYVEIPTAAIGYVQPPSVKEPMSHNRPQANAGGVDLGSGAFRGLYTPGLSLKGRGPDLGFAHYYNSFDSNRYPMGPGWSHTPDSYVLEDATGNVFVKWGDGTVSFFEKVGTTYVDRAGDHDQMMKIDDGSNYGFSITKKDQTVYEYRLFSVNPWPGTPPTFKHEIGVANRIALVSVTDWANNKLTYNNNAAYGNLESVADDFGRRLVLDYDLSLRLKSVREVIAGAPGRSVTFDYDPQGRLATFTDARQYATGYSYDDNNLLIGVTYPQGNTVAVEYDPATWKVQSFKAGNDSPARIEYQPAANTTSVTDPRGNVYTSTHQSFRLKELRGQAVPDPEKFVYGDPLNPNKPTHTEDREGNPTDYEYDAMGNVTKVKNAAGYVARFAYNGKNRLTSATVFHSPAGPVPPATTYTYDISGNKLIKITTAGGLVTDLHYGLDNQVDWVRDGRGMTTYYKYDLHGNLDNVTDPNGNITGYSNDHAGRTTRGTDADGKQTEYSYDANDHPTTITDPLSHPITLEYDFNGNLSRIAWANSGVSSDTRYAYNTEDRLRQLTNPLNVNSMYGYDPAGNLSSRTDFGGAQTLYRYDGDGRLDNVVYPDSTFVRYVRNRNGLPTSIAQTPGNSISFAYDNLSRVSTNTSFGNQVVRYEYDAAGRLWKLTYPGGAGKVVTYQYDADGRLWKVSDWLGGTTEYVYDASGNMTETRRPNGTRVLYSYDGASRLTRISDVKPSGSTVIFSADYTLSGAGDITGISATEPVVAAIPAEDVSYTYNAANRLLTAGTASFVYSPNGNRTSGNRPGGTTSYDWDAENRLTRVSSPARTVEHFYDGMGNRIARREGSATTRYVLDLNGDMSRVLAETDTSGNVTAWYVYGLGLVSKIPANGSQRFYHFNNRGDTVALTDGQGTVTDAYAYDEYGKLAASTGSTPNPFKFVGQHGVMDEGDNLYFMRARFYDAETGRFLSEDPLGFEGGDWNLVVYSSNNPILKIDPKGLKSVDEEERKRQRKAYLLRRQLALQREASAIEQRGYQIEHALIFARYIRGMTSIAADIVLPGSGRVVSLMNSSIGVAGSILTGDTRNVKRFGLELLIGQAAGYSKEQALNNYGVGMKIITDISFRATSYGIDWLWNAK